MNKFIRLFFVVILLTGCLVYIYYNRETLNTLRMVPLDISLITLVLYVGVLILHLYSNFLILHVYSPTLRFIEFAALTFIGTMVNTLVPLGSISTKAVYLKTVKTILYRDFILSHSLAGSIRFAVYGGCLLATLSFISMSGFDAGGSLWLASGFITFCGFSLSVLLLGVFKLPFRIPWLQRFYSRYLPEIAGLIKPVCMFTFLGALLNFICAGLVFSSLVGQSTAFIPGGLVGLVGGILVVLPITPGNLGSFQAISGVVSYLLGYDPVVGILASFFVTALRYAGITIIGLLAYFGCHTTNQVSGPGFTDESSG